MRLRPRSGERSYSSARSYRRQTVAVVDQASHLDDNWQCDRFLPVAIGRDGAVFKIGIDQVVKDIALASLVAEFFDRGTDLVER